MTGIKSLIYVCNIILVFSIASNAYAYKVDVHLYVAQEVLNDAQDGTLSFNVEGKETLDINIGKDVHKSLISHPEYFRTGSLGPDAFPDVFTGQTIIHPGIKGGWGTSDWLMHLSKDGFNNANERAFVAGFSTHIASDIFAHTYVNRYSGGVFDIQKAPSIAKRHVALESYISNYLPPIKDHRGRSLKKVSDLIMDATGQVAYPEEFVLQKLYFSPEAQAQFKLQGHPLTTIADLRDSLDELLKPDGLISDYDNLALQFAAMFFGEINLTTEEAEKAREFAESIHRSLDVSDDLAKISGEVDEFTQDLQAASHEAIRGALSELESAENSFLKEKAKIDNLRTSVTAKANEVAGMADNLRDSVLSEVSKRICKDSCAGKYPLSGSRRARCRDACFKRHTKVRVTVNGAKKKLRNEVASLQKKIIELENKEMKRASAALRESIEDTLSLTESVLETQIALNGVMRTFLELDTASSPVRLIFQNWRDGVDDAMTSYSRANAQSIINTTDPSIEDPLDPWIRWLSCDSVSLIGVPSGLVEAACGTKEGVSDILTKVNELEDSLVSIDPLGSEVIKLKGLLQGAVDALKDELVDLGVDEINKSVESLTDFDVLQWKELFERKVSAKYLNAQFSGDEDSLGLLVIPDIAKRVNKDMGIGWRSKSFKPEKFNALYNSIVLSKLSLLDRDGLIELSKYLGLDSDLYGLNLYDDTSRESENILFGFVRNIDGNHQWQELAPPQPRQGNFDAPDYSRRTSDLSSRYGMWPTANDKSKGLRLWVDEMVRTQSFKKLFRAPIAAGIDQPKKYRMSEILPDGYPKNHRVTNDVPWGDH